jgi:pyruvate ferredoxin oxidoreductase delta subunit
MGEDMIEMPQVNLEKCNKCGICVSVCHCSAIVLVNNTIAIVETQECGWCTLCEAVCPVEAISCSFEIVIEG